MLTLVRPSLWAAAIVLIVPPSAGAVSFSSLLRAEDPIRTEGIISYGPDQHPGPVVLAVQAGGQAADQVVLATDGGELLLHKWMGGAVCLSCKVPLTDGGSPEPSRLNVTAATLRLRDLHEAAQFAALPGDAAGTPMQVNGTGLRCAINHAGEATMHEFPADARRERDARMRPFTHGDHDLRADCAMQRLYVREPQTVWLYGMDLLLSSAEKSELIQTGTFEEPDPLTGLPRRVTAVLEVRSHGLPLMAEVPLGAEAQLHAREFLSVGLVDAPSGEGSIRWGEFFREGSVDAFSTEGSFLVSWREAGFISIRGAALEGPEGSPGEPPRSVHPDPFTILVGAAGLGIVVVAVRILWALFSTLKPQTLLGHPRRAEILELVRNQPGLETSAVARTLGLGWTKADYHIRRLQQAGHVTRWRVDGRTALFPTRQGFARSEEKIALLHRTAFARIHSLLQRRPRLDQESVAAALGFTRQRAGQVLRRLEAAGLVRSSREPRRRRYAALPTDGAGFGAGHLGSAAMESCGITPNDESPERSPPAGPASLL